MKTTLFILSLLVCSMSFAQKAETVSIKTSAECGMCKERIEGKLNYVKGIKFAELNYETQELTVKFDPRKIDLDAIRKHVSELGYDADEIPANKEEQDKLPACCKPGGMELEEQHN